MKSYIKKNEIRQINRKLYGYEIVFNNKEDYKDSGALELVIANIIQNYNANDEIAGVPTVINIHNELVSEQTKKLVELLNPNSVVICLNNKVLESSDNVALLKELKNEGYRLMIKLNEDDKYFNYASMMADIIKIDIKHTPEEINNKEIFSCKKLACNVDTADDYIVAEQAGIDYYEGSYDSNTIDMDIRNNGHSRVNFLEVVRLLNEKAELATIAHVVSRDPLLSAQVIRLCNSSGAAVKSVAEAVKLLGHTKLERWIYILQFGKAKSVPEDLIRESYNRAELCRLLSHKTRYIRNTVKEEHAYMIGLFSNLDILSGRSMNEELVSLNLDPMIESALVYRDGIGGDLLNLVISYEEANWDRIKLYSDRLKVDTNKLFTLYFDSVSRIAKIWDDLESYANINGGK